MRRLYLVTPEGGVVPMTWDPRRGILPPRVPFAADPILGRRLSPHELAGLGSFLKKVGNVVHNVVTAPLRAISPDLAKPLDKLHETADKVADKVTTQINNDLHKLGKWAKKNWKWIVIAAAIVLTIYTMGGTAGLVSQLQSAYSTVSTYVANHAWSLGLKAAGMVATSYAQKAAQEQAQAQAQAQMEAQQQSQENTLALALALRAMERLLAGQKIGDLSPEEVEAVATVNDRMGAQIVPAELLKYFVQVPGGASAIKAVQDGEMDLDPVDTAQPTAAPAGATAPGAVPVPPAAPSGPKPVVEGQTSLRLNTSAMNAAAYAASLQASAEQEAAQQQAAASSIASWAALRASQGDPTAYAAMDPAMAPLVAQDRRVQPPTSASVPSWLLPVGLAAVGVALLMADA